MLEQWAAAGVKTVVTPCADCRHTFTRAYPKYEGASEDMPEILHTVECVDRLVKDGRLELTAPVPLTVTYHDPCNLGRQGEPYTQWEGVEKKIYGQAVVYDPPRPRHNGANGVYDAPRDVLAAIPGVELVEMERSREAAWCCGAGGACREAFPEYSAATAAERVEEAASTGAEALVTACSRCELNFAEAVAADTASGGPGADLQVHDVLELVALSAGIREGGLMSPSYAKPTTPAETAAASAQITDEAYRALEDIVGADNVSRDAAILDTYAFQWLAELVRPDQSHYMPRPAAVVLPGSTEEVQAIVRLANKYGLKVKPHGTGWYHWSGPIKDSDATLQLDLRRMDAIVEIDEQNMYAVVEPYVIAAQLQAEILPLGLNLNIPGVGCSSSIVASACAYHGAGPDTYYMGGNAENVLGMEWVTPEGEIVRTGSLG